MTYVPRLHASPDHSPPDSADCPTCGLAHDEAIHRATEEIHNYLRDRLTSRLSAIGRPAQRLSHRAQDISVPPAADSVWK